MLIHLDTKNQDILFNCQCTQDAVAMMLEVKRFINTELRSDKSIRGSAYQLACETQQMLELYIQSNPDSKANIMLEEKKGG